MAEEFTIFQKSIKDFNGYDSYEVRLSSDKDNALTAFTPISLNMTEALSYVSPMVSITFLDLNGDLFNTFKLDPDGNYHIAIGRNLENMVECDIKPTKITLNNQVAGQSRNILFTVHFSHRSWYEMVSKRHNKSWRNARISDIVGDVVESSEFNELDIPETRIVFDRMLQPHWTNVVWLNWLKKRCQSRDDEYGHFEFGTTFEGKFFFKSLATMINEQLNDIQNGDIPVFVMQGQKEQLNERLEEERDNKQIPAYFLSFNLKEHYMSSVLNGSGGVRSIWYDTKTDTLHDSDITFSDSQSVQLTEWGAIKASHEENRKVIHGGRSSCSDDEALYHISNTINSVNSFDITFEAGPQATIGDVVETIIPVPNEPRLDPFNLTYSGFYMVGSVTHSISFEDSSFLSSMTLIRQGYDNSDLDGYVQSRKGRVI